MFRALRLLVGLSRRFFRSRRDLLARKPSPPSTTVSFAATKAQTQAWCHGSSVLGRGPETVVQVERGAHGGHARDRGSLASGRFPSILEIGSRGIAKSRAGNGSTNSCRILSSRWFLKIPRGVLPRFMANCSSSASIFQNELYPDGCNGHRRTRNRRYGGRLFFKIIARQLQPWISLRSRPSHLVCSIASL